MQPLDSVPMAWLAPLPFGCRRTPFELMDFGLESSQLVHPFSSQREFALRIVAYEPPPHCAAPPLKTGPKRHTSFEVSVCSWTSTMIWTWTCQSILIIGLFKCTMASEIHGPTKKKSLIFGTVSEGIIYPHHPQKIWIEILLGNTV